MKNLSKMAQEILDALVENTYGLTLKEISEKIDEKGCGHDCEKWIETFLEAGIIEKCGNKDRADLYRLTEKGRTALG